MRQHRQIHLWVTESDYRLLREQSADERESVSGILRRLIRNERCRLSDERRSAIAEPAMLGATEIGSCPEPALLDAS